MHVNTYVPKSIPSRHHIVPYSPAIGCFDLQGQAKSSGVAPDGQAVVKLRGNPTGYRYLPYDGMAMIIRDGRSRRMNME